jgi:hypothetical protein
MSYEEYKTWHSWWYFYQWAYENPEQPPWHFYPDGYIEATNGVGLGAGTYFAVTKIPWDSEPGLHKRTWMWLEWERVTYATWEFQSVYTNQSLVNTWEIYLKPTLPDMPTQIWTNEVPGPVPGSILDWTYPQSWTVTVSAKFKELEGMPTNVYTKLNSSFVNESDGVLTVVFGSDEFPPLDAAASEPDYPSPPTEATAALDLVYNDNTGSVGTMKGSYVNPSDYFFVKTWQFNYCTNK